MRFKAAGIYLLLLLTFWGCGKNPFKDQLDWEFGKVFLTTLPCYPLDVTIMQPYGVVSLPNEPYAFHAGIDMSTQNNKPFFSCADGKVEKVELNTGQGYAGTNYRIHIRLNKHVFLDYHFEIGGSVPEATRRNSIFVSEGNWVRAGQHIANLLVLSEAGHVDLGVNADDQRVCPLDYCTEEVARQFEAMYDQHQVEKRPAWRENLK